MNYIYVEKHWEHISPEAKAFIRKLLAYKPSDRISAKDALGDPWMKANPRRLTKEAQKESATSSLLSLKSLQTFKVLLDFECD